MLSSFASRSPSGDRPTFLSALLQIPPPSYFPGFTVVYFTSLIRPGAVPSEGRWRRHPRSASLAALLPGVLLYDRLGISHGTLAPSPAEEPRPGPPVHHSGTPQQRVCVEIASQLARHGGGRLTGRRLVADTRSTFNHIADAPWDEATLLPTGSADEIGAECLVRNSGLMRARLGLTTALACSSSTTTGSADKRPRSKGQRVSNASVLPIRSSARPDC